MQNQLQLPKRNWHWHFRTTPNAYSKAFFLSSSSSPLVTFCLPTILLCVPILTAIIFNFLPSITQSRSHPLYPTRVHRLQIQSLMATLQVLQREDLPRPSPLIHPSKGGSVQPRELSIEQKIEFLESITGKVSNRRTRRLLNDRLLMELVPRLNPEEIRGLFAPPPWGNIVPPSAFSMTSMGDWDKFRNIDMDKEASIIGALDKSSARKKFSIDGDKLTVLNAWRRIDCRTREAMRRCLLSDLIEKYEICVRAFIEESGDEDTLTMSVQDPFHRLLLHGVCEFYNLTSVTVAQSKGAESLKVTKITKKKKPATVELPNITLAGFLKMSKEGIW